jgi:hypothetical protein
VAWEGEVWLFLKVGRWDFFNFLRNFFFGGVGRGGWKKGLGVFFVFFVFFCDMVT